MGKCMTAQMKTLMFYPFDPIFIFGFLKNFKLTFETNCIHEGVSMWPFHFFINKSALAELKCQTHRGQHEDGAAQNNEW